MGRKLAYTLNCREAKNSTPDERGDVMRSKTRFMLAILWVIFASASALAQVERAAARANRPL
ncbi:MAG: hypothetical protein A3J28_16335 [Acidobacteria bacterium RIFCSPLOWO2_12_FULL_60_22]|nr:MAG: hypothetical protein A3J28_16335 [Acidobacteria bacterium RIFCSPLOWO2_12_FULL_60_22]